jgi:hypothetical protein
MRNDRAGESLWLEWDGEGYPLEDPDATILYTLDHVDVHDEVPRRALASALQRYGIVDGLGGGYKAAERAVGTQGYAGTIDGERALTACDEDGSTFYGDELEDYYPVTWVEVSDGEG